MEKQISKRVSLERERIRLHLFALELICFTPTAISVFSLSFDRVKEYFIIPSNTIHS